MSTITDKKITDGQRDAVRVQHQPNRLTGTPKQNQKVFDDYAELIREHFNEAIDAIDERISTNDSDIEQLKETDAGIAATSARESADSALESAQTTANMLGRVISISNKTYTKTWDVTEEQDEFVFTADGYTYNESDTYEVFVNGLKLADSEFTRSENSVILNSSISGAGNTVEIIVTTNLKGKGVTGTELNEDYTLTINYDDGTFDTTDSIRGEKGEKGDKGDKGDEYDDTQVKTDISVLDARVDSFTHLAEGSTTGDAELIDARIGHNGKTYTNAGGAIRTQVGNLDSIVKQFNSYPISDGFITKANGTHNGVTYTWNSDGSCTVSGTSTGVSVNALLANSPLPSGIVAGQTYRVKYKTTNSNVSMNFIFRQTSSGTPTYVDFKHDGYVTIPTNATYMALRLYVTGSGKDFTTPATVSEIAILTTETVPDIVDGLYIGKDKSHNSLGGLTYFNISDMFNASNPATPADIPVNSYCYTVGSRLNGFPIKSYAYYWVFCVVNQSALNVRQLIVINANAEEKYSGFTSDSGTTVSWHTSSDDLRILHIGSSFGQDSVVYAPFIIDLVANNIPITMGLSYISGGTITQYNGYFDDDTALSYYKRPSSWTTWSTVQSKSLKQILTDEKWDIVTFQQSAYDGGVWSTFSNLNSFIDKVVNYCMSQNNHGIKAGYIMPQAAVGYSSRYSYSDMVDCVQRVLDTTPIDFVIPCGTGIENARHTSLVEIGDNRNLVYDTTGHLQEGLPVLLSSYVTALKILELCGVQNSGILGDTTRPTADWVSSHNIPGQNGTSTGVTDANCLLAQKCAIAAIKKPFETSSIVE